MVGPMDKKEIESELDTSIIWASEPEPKEWQCIECGHVRTAKTRPKYCPNCNCVNGDLGSATMLFARREAIGWFELE